MTELRLILLQMFTSYSLNFVDGITGHLQTSTISYLEPVHYDRQSLHHQHRTRRSTRDIIQFSFEAFSRQWNIKLRSDNTVFHNDIVVENSKGPVKYEFDSAYTGVIDGERSHVFGTITSAGYFEGQIQSLNGTFIVENSRKHNFTNTNFHTVIYNINNVKYQKESNFCGAHKTIKKPIPVVEDIAGKEVWNNDFKLRYTSSANDKHRRFRRAVDPNKKICELYVQVDHTLFFKFNNVTDDVIAMINNHVMAVNPMYNSVDFDDDSVPDNIGFSIKRIKIYDDPTVSGYKYSGNHGVNSMLFLHSEDDYDSFCLSYIFTYRDFDQGILGLAWTAEPDTSGGLCSKYTLYTDGRKSLNTGVVTFLNYGTDVNTAVSYVTFAHEIGHNFGSLHDEASNPTCAPGGSQGNYIMFAQATSGTKPNNVLLSSCSISYMAPMVESRGRDIATGCFVAYSASTCGNKVVEDGEQCDCGWDEECTDTCCNPSTSGPESNLACTRKAGASCSPSEGVCCNPETCSPYSAGNNHVCRTNSSCLDTATCNGGLTCPDSVASANGTVCDDEKVCYLGQCSGQVCQAHGYEPCQCEGASEKDWNNDILCTLCCIDPSNDTCKTADKIAGINVPFTNAVPGTPCNNFLGYCDVFHICREVDPSGPLSKLKDFFLGGELIDKVKEFLTEHWYVGIAGGVGLIILLVLLVKCCSKSTKAKVDPEPRRISVERRTRY